MRLGHGPSLIVWAFLIAIVFAWPSAGLAEELATGDSAASSRSADVAPDEGHPILSANGTWAGIVVIVVVCLVLAAAVIGPIVRAEMPGEVPEAFSHTEDPGHHSGT